MKIVYILTKFPCRSETFAVREIEALRLLGFDITVLAASGQDIAGCGVTTVKTFYRPQLFSAKGIFSLSYLCLRHPLGLCRLFCLILKLLRQCRREAITLLGNLHTVGYFAWRLKRGRISHIHAYFMSWPALLGLALRVSTGRQFSIGAHARDIFVEEGAAELKASRANFIRTCTRRGLRQLQTLLPTRYHHKLFVVYHSMPIACGGINPATLGEDQSKADDIVVAVGRLVSKKGFANLVRAFALLGEQRPNCKLIIAGDGPERERLAELAEELSIQDQVQLLGWLPCDAALRLIRSATVLAAPAVIDDDGDSDGIPNVILEAFVSGTAIVASRLSSISEAVRHGWTGLLVEPGNIEQLAWALKRLLEDSGLRSRLSQRAYEVAVQRFDTTKNVRSLAELFRKEYR